MKKSVRRRRNVGWVRRRGREGERRFRRERIPRKEMVRSVRRKEKEGRTGYED